jgi:hypothetical protein
MIGSPGPDAYIVIAEASVGTNVASGYPPHPIVVNSGHRVLELPHPVAELAARLREPFRPEDEQQRRYVMVSAS